MNTPQRGFAGWLNGLTLWIGGFALILMMLHISASVISLKLFGRPIPGTLEFVTYPYMLSVVFLPLAATQVAREHVIVEVFTQGLSRRRLARLDALVAVIVGAYLGFLTWFSAVEALRSTRRNEVIRVFDHDLPLWITRWIVLLGFGGMFIVLLVQVLRHLRDDRDTDAAPPTEGRH